MRTQRSPEEVQEWREKMAGLAATVRAMDAGEREALAARIGTVTCEGHPLTPFNTVFLATQAGDVVPAMVGGFRQWKKIGRQVRKGEHAIGRIWVPKRKGEAAAGEAQGEDEKQGFILVPVFDLSQTDEAGEAERGAA